MGQGEGLSNTKRENSRGEWCTLAWARRVNCDHGAAQSDLSVFVLLIPMLSRSI